ncbi:MAG: acyltransferase domain-containing protein [Coriobacteriales bacterium]|jgi:acyl transferase domain-containing protein|nr:acyltransferase domain-containing protein [Coriobacteriales bacterium]
MRLSKTSSCSKGADANSDADRDIAIVGISIFCPAGESVDEFWDGIARGGDFITDAPPDIIESCHFEGEPNGVDRFYCKRGGFNKAFKVDPLRYGILPITADGIDPDQFVSLAGSEQALVDAGVFEKGISLQKCSVIIGKGNFSGVIPLRSLEIIRMARQVSELVGSVLPKLTDEDLRKIQRAYQSRQGRYQADMSIGTMPSLVASLVANRFDMHGPAYTVDAACASGILAISQSIEMLRSGQCDIGVAGGMHVGHSAMFWGAFDMMGAMSRRQQIAPLSEDADGLLVGQGGGFIVLKTVRKALEDGDRIYAVIKDTAVSSDGAGSHVTVTSVKGQVRVLKQAWERAGMDPRRIGYVEAHGTATPVGDRTEIATLKEFFGDKSQQPALVGSVKSNIGHTMPAAGMIGIIKTALALYHRKIPPTLHCERPLVGMFESRFLPPQELIDWDDERYPLVAGVNAFGFGGINAHAIMVPYEPAPGMPPAPKPRPYFGEAIMVSAPSREALRDKLEAGDYTNTGGDYRIVVFSPSDERVKQAITIVERDKPWRGKMDIWFSNHPLLTNGGKIVFLCPGFGPEGEAETDSISEVFGLPFIKDELANQDDLELTQTTLRYYYTAQLCKDGLGKLGVEPDCYAGHSAGEWNATLFAKMTDGDWNHIYQSLVEWDIPVQYPLLAVGGIDSTIAEQWCAEIPDLYLVSDNCPSQILLSGKQEAVDILMERLNKQRLFYSQLPYGTGFHTPLIPDNSDKNALETVSVHEGVVPVWSSTTLERIPTDMAEYIELTKDQMRRPVYFRGLIEKLYREQDARVFIQIGLGALVGFVEDTLKGQEFSAVGSCVNNRDGCDQLRRVLAAIFVEGQEVDAAFLGVKPVYRVSHSLMNLRRGMPPVISEMSELTEVVQARYGGAVESGFAWENSDAEASDDPILMAEKANVRAIAETQGELVHLFKQTARPQAAGEGAAQKAAAVQPEAATKQTSTAANTSALLPSFEEQLLLTFEDHPYLVDHSIVRQPKGWEFADDLNLVVPFTMTIELLAETAKRHAPKRKLIKIGRVTAYRWVSVERPFEGTVVGSWKQPNLLELNLKGYAKAEFTFGEEWPEVPAAYVDELDIGEALMDCPSAESLYERFSFHGPQYHSCTEVLKIASRGMRVNAQRREGKGSLLDIMGQQLGLFLHLTQTVNTISFPVRLKELNFYADIFDQTGSFEHTMVVTSLTEHSIAADMVLKRDGKIWSVAREFVCQRFQNVIPVWNVILSPQSNILVDEIAPNVYHYANTSSDNILALLTKRYLNDVDRDQQQEAIATGLTAQEHLIGRIVLKDAVRSFARRETDEMIYPVEIFCERAEDGRLTVRGHGSAAELLKGVEVSLSSRGREAVAIVANEPVGIALEKLEEKPEDFWKDAFTAHERELLAALPAPEGALRLWVAKEACAQKAGVVLEDNPQHFEVSAVDGETVSVGTQKVQTRLLGTEYLTGWTTGTNAPLGS